MKRMKMRSSFYFEDNNLVLRVRRGRNLSFPAHIQNQFEFFHVVDGRCTVEVDSVLYPLAAGESVAVWPLMAHAYRHEGDYSFMMCIMDTALVPEYSHMFSEFKCVNPFVPCIRLNPKVPQILHELSGDTSLSAVLQKFYAAVMLGHLLESLTLEPGGARLAGEDTLCALLTYISHHVSEQLTLGNLSEALFLSRFSISRILSERVGYNLRTYINILRVSKAQTLMANSRLSIREIIGMCGFDSERTFYRAFQTHLGVSPGTLRNQLMEDSSFREAGIRIEKDSSSLIS